ncbi:YoaK family protein [Mucilaginibacter endophyticus]|uniref:YoaK family protein n=1 Tax=Mucilaginibacter endophyticus TaxID=2675003 RepID=UPI000E0D44ED|nr:YoaK family protein [Mucilaginibacter endophyticus]
MKRPKQIALITILLSVTAGYCDSVTFVSLQEFFSSHVTGNLVVFAYDVVKHVDTSGWIKLLSFPVFIVGVIVGGAIDSHSKRPYLLLFIEGIILFLFGAIWLILFFTGNIPGETPEYIGAMTVVFAMGLQNAFAKIHPKKTYGPTTMMTGLVIEAALNIGAIFRINGVYALSEVTLYRQLMTIGAFLFGCISGALLGQWMGLSAFVFPGIFLVVYCFRAKLAIEQHQGVTHTLSSAVMKRIAN